jgi:hypothetical protein
MFPLSIEGAQVVSGPGGNLYLWRPAPTIVVGRVVGALTPAGVNALEEEYRRTIAEHGRHLGFHDWEAMTDYDFADRLRLTAAVARHMGAVDGLHFLTKSKAVTFGVQAANLVLGRITVHPSRESFDNALREAVRTRIASFPSVRG